MVPATSQRMSNKSNLQNLRISHYHLRAFFLFFTNAIFQLKRLNKKLDWSPEERASKPEFHKRVNIVPSHTKAWEWREEERICFQDSTIILSVQFRLSFFCQNDRRRSFNIIKKNYTALPIRLPLQYILKLAKPKRESDRGKRRHDDDSKALISRVSRTPESAWLGLVQASAGYAARSSRQYLVTCTLRKVQSHIQCMINFQLEDTHVSTFVTSKRSASSLFFQAFFCFWSVTALLGTISCICALPNLCNFLRKKCAYVVVGIITFIKKKKRYAFWLHRQGSFDFASFGSVSILITSCSGNFQEISLLENPCSSPLNRKWW